MRMKKLSSYTSTIILILSTLLLAKLLSVALFFFLPKTSLEKTPAPQYSLDFRRYEVKSTFGLVESKQKNMSLEVEKKPLYDLKNLVLQAIYDNHDSGVIVLFDTKKNQAVILAMMEVYEGYKLVEIYPKYVVFTKQDKRYVLRLFDDVDIEKSKPSNKTEVQNSSTQKVAYQDVLRYTNDFESIWKNIAIKEVKENNKIIGFKVEYILQKSVFGQLGLKRGDIITKVNSQPLTSYSEAFRIYNNIQSYNYIVITILRDGKEKDLNYEIQ